MSSTTSKSKSGNGAEQLAEERAHAVGRGRVDLAADVLAAARLPQRDRGLEVAARERLEVARATAGLASMRSCAGGSCRLALAATRLCAQALPLRQVERGCRDARPAQARARARRARAARRLAPAAAAAVARRARTATPGRSPPATASCCSTPACTSRARSRTSSARWSMVNLRLENVRLLVCTHAHSDHYGQARDDRRARRLRAVDASQPRAHDARRAGPRGGARAAHRGRAPERRARRSRCALRASARRGQGFGIAGVDRARPRPAAAASRSRPTSATWEVVRDARPRALARLPVPARAPAADLRRPPARAASRCTTTTATRPTRRASSCTRWTSSRSSTRACACPGHGRTFTDVQAHIDGQPRARRRAPREACATRHRGRADHGVRRRPARLRRRRSRR